MKTSSNQSKRREPHLKWLRAETKNNYTEYYTSSHDYIGRETIIRRILVFQFTKETNENGKILFLDFFVTHENKTRTNHCLQETNIHSQITWPNVWQSHFTQSDYCSNLEEKSRPNNSSNNSYTITAMHYTLYTVRETSRILWPHNIQVAHKPMFTLRCLLTMTNVRDKDKPEDRPGAGYKIKCSDCQVTYIGETGRNFTIRLSKQKQATKRVTSTTTLPTST